jgi:hypothetical protein
MWLDGAVLLGLQKGRRAPGTPPALHIVDVRKF